MTEREPGEAAAAAADETGTGTGTGPPFRYNARLAAEIERRWQQRWADEGTFNSHNPSGPLAPGFERMAGRPKFYVLDMFTYPSGDGLHVGHPLGYIATDVFARYLRMTGHHVLHTFGYDAFGLPAEQYAIETGQHPAVTTRRNIESIRHQLRRLGLGHDTRREISTADPSFYRWTQWMFLKIWDSWADETGRARSIGDLVAELESGARPTPDGRAWAALTGVERRHVIDGHRLAYIAEELVNWCPGLGTVLANEEVTAEGRSEVGNYPVYRRALRQWLLRITALADRLIEDLDLVDWPESIKQMQRNWIGRSDGARIKFRAARHPAVSIEVFTTRPDTLPGATYLVLAPEHPLADRLIPEAWPADTPPARLYPQARQSAEARDPASGWTPRRAVAAYREMTSRRSDRQRLTAESVTTGVFTGGYVINPATGEPIPVFLADYVLMNYGTGAIMAVPAHDQRDRDFAREFGLPMRPVTGPPDSWPRASWPRTLGAGMDVAAAIAWLEESGAGRAGRGYRLRDWLFSRQRYWGEPFPIVYDEDGLPVALPEDTLPVRLPEMDDFRPEPRQDEASDPVPPLARATAWATVELDLGNGPRRYRRELSTMPQWAGSCWYYLRYLDPANRGAFVAPDIERYWMVPPDATRDGEGGVDLYVGGVEHAVLHLLYARFWHKVLYDLGYVSTTEPFRRLLNQGYILADAFTDARGRYVPAADVRQAGDGSLSYHGRPVTRRAGKMGKSLKNSVSPEDICTRYGADTLRLYEMAMGPLGTDRPWQTRDIAGLHRFLQRLWRGLVDEQTGSPRVSGDPLDPGTLRKLHAAITIVREDFGALSFNTAIARLIELTAHAIKITGQNGFLPRALAEPLVLMVAPLAPHIAEELWGRLGHPESLAYARFPEPDPELAGERAVTIPVQVNGKTLVTIEVPVAAGQAEIEQALNADPGYRRHTAGRAIRRLIIVPGRIVNVLIGDDAPGGDGAAGGNSGAP